MARRTRNESAQKQAIRKMMKSYLNDNEISIKDGGDVVNADFKTFKNTD